MTSRIPAHRRARIAAAATFGALLFVVACEMTPRGSSPSPTEPELADVMTPEVDGASERVMIRVLDQDSAGGRIIGGNISPEGEVTIVRVGPDGDTTEIRDGRIRVSPLSDLERDGARPLYIVDGERMESIAGLDPSRIVAIDVLKGDLAVQQYGPEAKDGVVQVRTGEPGGAVRVPLGDARASASREVVLDFAHDGAAVRLEEREPGESRIQVSIPDNPDARPLILVDGKPGSIEALDPSQILTIEVIKDADATAVYGPEAKDGVISVKTRPTAPARVRAPQPAEAPEKVETGAMVAPAKASGVAARSQAVEVVSSEVAALSEAVRASAPQVSDRAAEVEVARVQQAAARVQREAEVARVQREVEAVRAQREVEVTRVQQAAEVARAAANAQTIAGSIAEPLIIVEGEVISSRAELNDRFPPESIEAVRVLKDRAATDVYGERARNGVIIVELKD